jgi:hypothetical protein
MQELPDLAAELGEVLVLLRGKVVAVAHICIVTRYIL